MELVYLWVEDYKNIKKQGFNFSSKFICDYDEAKNELTVEDNPEYIPDFFGENINVTAIVGKNGSGKSSVFEVLAFLYWQGAIPLTDKKDKTFFLYESNGHFHIQCENYKIYSGGFKGLFKNIHNNTKIKSPTSFSARTQMPLVSFSNCISDMTYNKHLKRLKTYDSFYNGVQPINPMMQNKEPYFNFNEKFLYLLKEDKTLFSFLEKDIFIFDAYRYQLHIAEFEAYIVQFDDKEYSKKISFQTHDKQYSVDELLCKLLIYLALYDTRTRILINLNSNYTGSHKDMERFPTITDYNTYIDKHIDKVLNIEIDVYDVDSLKNIVEKCNKFLKKCNLELLNETDWCLNTLYSKLDIKKEIHGRENRNNTKSFDATVKYNNIWDDSYIALKSINQEFNKYFIGDNQLIKTLQEYNILRVNFLDSKNEDKTFFDLSSGEKLYLNVLVNYAYTICQKKDKPSMYLFDEIELSFHPAWQKKIIYNLAHLSKKLVPNMEQHCIFTTHSPFLLSDIPKQNIIFLDKDENGNCKVVNGLKEKKQTFGANIHTLLSDSFFMEDGLMGEFAKGKTDKAIKLLNQEKLSEDDLKYCEQIISIIGEPIIKNQLQRILDSKRLKKVDEIDAIKKSMKTMRQRLDELEK